MTTTAKRGSSRQVATQHVHFLLDESGSMGVLQASAIEAYNAYVDELAKGKTASRIKFSLTTFDSTAIRRRVAEETIKDVPKLDFDTYVPNAGTPLYDAVGRVIDWLDREVKKGETVMVSIFTDGLENASRAYDRAAIFEKIQARQGKDWTFTYMGSNQDAWLVASSIGIPMGNAATFTSTPRDVSNAYRVMAKLHSEYLTADLPATQAMYSRVTDPTGHIRGDSRSTPEPEPPHKEENPTDAEDAWA